jgi:DNA polymerase-3 subunit beta
MIFSIDRQAFIDGLKLVGKAVNTGSTLPVLSNVLIQVTETVRLRTTNLELVLSADVSAAIEQPGSVTLPYRALKELLEAIESEAVALTLDPARDEVTIVGDDAEVRLKGTDADEFPAINTVLTENVTRLFFEADELERSWGSVAFAAATEDARPTLTTMLVRVADGIMVMAATDGFRLTWRHDPVTVMEGSRVEALIPAETIRPILSLIKGQPATLVFNCNELVIETETRLAKVKLLDGRYPDYEALIGDESKTIVQVNRDGLAASLSLMVAMNKWADGNPAVVLTWEEGSDDNGPVWLLSAAASGTGVAEAVHRPIELVGPAPARCAFNAQYVADALSHCPGELVAMTINNQLSPMLVRPLTGADWNCLIMPQHLL